ncbi:MAG: hypothetical protein WB677_15850, partial [Xanthobacteraceae bacterium]
DGGSPKNKKKANAARLDDGVEVESTRLRFSTRFTLKWPGFAKKILLPTSAKIFGRSSRRAFGFFRYNEVMP